MAAPPFTWREKYGHCQRLPLTFSWRRQQAKCAAWGSEAFSWPDGTCGLLLGGAANIPLTLAVPTCALLKLFYACDEPCELEIHHGKSSTHVLLPATASRWDKCSFRLPILLEGSDRNIKLSRISGDICAIEKIQLVESGLAHGRRYAAKNATLRGGAELAQKRSGAWDAVGAGEEADIVFDKVMAERAGWARVGHHLLRWRKPRHFYRSE